METKKGKEKAINIRKNSILNQIRINELNSDYDKMIKEILIKAVDGKVLENDIKNMINKKQEIERISIKIKNRKDDLFIFSKELSENVKNKIKNYYNTGDFTQNELATMFGTTQSTISKIIKAVKTKENPMKFIFDEAGVKSVKDNGKFGVVAGFFLTEAKERILQKRTIEILNKYDVLKEVKKIHMSEIFKVNKEQGKLLENEFFSLLNDLEIPWTFAAIKNISKNIKSKKNIPKCIRMGSFLEILYMRISVNVFDYMMVMGYKKNIEFISDMLDKTIVDNFIEFSKNTFMEEKNIVMKNGYDFENKIPIKCAELNTKQEVNKELKKFFNNLNFKVDESNILSFIADIITYRVYKILKENENVKVYNKKEIMISHPCKYIFMLGEDEEDYLTEEWLE
ncbi:MULTISPECIES: hypothetical protein [Fusobacterium]|uniref:hypothetical protein n=1 Tax=Fusobacterium TaxID=848 RepID=UPI0030D0D687